MKYSLVCPRCGGKKIYAIKQASMPCCHDARQTRPLSIAATGWQALRPSMITAVIEARVCDRCGLTELYTRNTDALALMDELELAQVRLYDGEDEGEGEPAAHAPPAGPAEPGRLDVLLVAGAEVAAELAPLLETCGHRVVIAGSAELAARLGATGARFQVAVVACDLAGPRDGLRLAEAMLGGGFAARVVTLLARSDIADAMRARALGPFVRLGKADTSERLVAALRQEIDDEC